MTGGTRSTVATRSVRQACIPRADTLQEQLDDALFAASLDAVARTGSAPPVYGDAATFFRNTHPSENLRYVADRVFDHLGSTTEPGKTFRLNTGFGGGKTHALIALWHLARQSGRADLGNEFVPSTRRPSGVAVAAVDGQSLGANVVSFRGSTWLRTIWADIAWQLGGEDAYRRLVAQTPDDPAVLPPLDVTRSIIPPGPVLLLFDELVLYLAAQGAGQANAHAARTTLLFIRQLMFLSGQVPGLVVVLTDPGPQSGYQGLTDQMKRLNPAEVPLDMQQDALREGQQWLAGEVGRLAQDVDPVGTESVAVLTRRLFETVDGDVARAVAEEYHASYRRVFGEHPDVIPPEATTAAYQEEIRACYPFHPRLLRTVRERLQVLPEFQRSRGTLRLFARLVKQVWMAGHDTLLIGAGELDWKDAPLKAELLDRLQRSSFTVALDADVLGHAPELDRQFTTGDAHARVARALLLECLQLSPEPSMTVADLTLACLRPSDAGTELRDAIVRLSGEAWHIIQPGPDRYRIAIEPSVIKQLEQQIRQVSEADAVAYVRGQVQQYVGQTPLQLVAFPRDAKAVSDGTSGTLALCGSADLARDVVAYRDTTARDRPPPGQPPGSAAPRQYRNTIVALAPRDDLAETAARLARRLLAARKLDDQLRTEATRVGPNQISALVALQQLKPIIDRLPREVTEASRQAWNTVILPDNAPLTLTEEFITTEVGVTTSGQAQLLRMLRRERLAFDDQDALSGAIIAERVLHGATPHDGQTDVVTAKAMAERALALPDLRLFTDQIPIRRGLSNGIREGFLVVRTSDGHAYSRDRHAYGPEDDRKVEDWPAGRDLPLFALDAMTLVTRPGTGAAKEWFHVKDIVDPPLHDCHCGSAPTTPLPGFQTVYDWAQAKTLAATRPLAKLILKHDQSGGLNALLVAARTLNARSSRMSINVDGVPAGGGSGDGNVHLEVTNVRPDLFAGLADVVGRLSRSLASPDFAAELEMEFGDVPAQMLASGRLVTGVPNEAQMAIIASFGVSS